jgi:hypothetical protein
LRSGSAYAQSAVRPVIIVEPPSSKPLPTPPNVLTILPEPDQRRRNATASNRPHSDFQLLPSVEYDHAYEGDVLTIVRTDISHEHEEVRMGRTKHGLPPRSKSEREFDHEIGNIVFVLNAIDAGRLDHLFVDAETKAAVRADWMAKGEAVVRKYVRAYPTAVPSRPPRWRYWLLRPAGSQ